MSQPILAYLLRKFWSALVVFTVSLAVMVSLARIMLPGIGDYREDIQIWVSESLGQPVDIEHIEADWSGWTPNLRLTNITLLDREGGRIITRFEKLTISLNILSSLYNKRFVPGHLILSGIELSLIRKPDGTVTIEGVSSEEENTTALEKNALAYWLEHQSDLAIQSARVIWNDQALDRAPLTFDQVTLKLQNRGNQHRFRGSALLPEETGTAVVFILDAEGDLLTRGWSGQLFVEASGLNADKLLAYSRLPEIKPTNGELRFRLWSDWKDARLQSVTADFTAEDMDFGSAQNALTVTTAQAEIRASRNEQNDWDIIGQGLGLHTLNGSWPDSGFEIHTRHMDDGLSVTAELDFLRLEDLLPILSSADLFSPQTLKHIEQTAPHGDLQNLQFSFNNGADVETKFHLSSDFTDLQTTAVDEIPGLNGLDGQFTILPQKGSLHFDTRSAQVDLQQVFKQAVWLDQIKGRVDWQLDDSGWNISTERLQLVSSDLDANLSGKLFSTGEGIPHVDMVAEFARGNVSSVGRYLPWRIMPEKASSWLGSALVGGTIVGGGMILRGDLAHFPFDDHSGRFEVRALVEDGILDYADEWPRIEEIEAEVLFTGRGMVINAVSGKVFDAEIQQATATISNLGLADRVIIDGSLKGDVLAGYEFISNSPLKHSVGKRLDRIGLSNEIKVDLILDIPLGKSDRKVSTRGKIHFEENVAIQPRFNITLDKLKGTYSFKDDQVADGEFTAEYHQTPIRLVLRDSPEIQATVIDMQGHATPEFIRDRLSEAAPGAGDWLVQSGLFAVLDGKTKWQARMELPVNEKDPLRPASLEISTDLRGMSISAPAPLGKKRRESFPFSIHTPLGDQQEKRISFTYSDILSGKFHLMPGNQGSELKRTEIQLGQHRRPKNTTDALWIGGHLADLELSHWIDFYRQQETDTELSDGGFPSTTIDLEVEQLKAYGQTLNQANIQASNPAGNWLFTLDGQEAKGQIKIPADLDKGLVELEFEHLALNTDQETTEQNEEKIDPRRFPRVKASIDRLKLDERQLGQVNLSTHTNPEGVSIDHLVINNPEFEISADGQWLVRDDQQVSRFNIIVAAPKLEGLLNHFGYEGTAIEDAQTQISLKAGWPGSLMDFSMEKLNGKLRMDIKQGRFIDINASAGKIFGLLSLQGLRRRLSLDFNDLFKKGFSFDYLTGSFVLENGHAYTNDMLIQGPSATININGRTGLAEQDYDQLVTVTPAFASSLPVASALFGPVGVGIGAVVLLAEKVFKSLPDRIDQVLSRQYAVTGSWEAPEVTRLRGEENTPVEPDQNR